MGASELIDVDVHAHAVVRTLPDLPDIHGVIVVPGKHRVYATATGNNQLVAIDEDSGQVVFRAPTDTYPDGLAYDPIRRTVWTTNESAGTETVLDADSGAGIEQPADQRPVRQRQHRLGVRVAQRPELAPRTGGEQDGDRRRHRRSPRHRPTGR